MVDVRVPEIQANQCLSCHIGDASQGKVVTHEMYAAGHPPLPSIEVATFANSIPRHWMSAEGEDPGVPQGRRIQGREQEQTKLALVGAAVAPEDLDEAACRGDQGERNPGVRPGLARLRPVRLLVVPPRPEAGELATGPGLSGVARSAADQRVAPGDGRAGDRPPGDGEQGQRGTPAELAGHQKAILGEANGKPFGKKVSLAKAAEDFAGWADVLIEKLSAAAYDDEVALQLLKKLVARAQEKVTDYDEARHIAWTIKILAADAGPKLTNRDRIDPILAKFDEKLKLVLPAGRKYQIDDQLGKALQAIGDYEPSEFREHLKELAASPPSRMISTVD